MDHSSLLNCRECIDDGLGWTLYDAFGAILPGNKSVIKGALWPKGTVLASANLNFSYYAHNRSAVPRDSSNDSSG